MEAVAQGFISATNSRRAESAAGSVVRSETRIRQSVGVLLEIEFGSTAMQDPFVTIGVGTEVVADGGGDGVCVHAAVGCLHRKKNPRLEVRVFS